MPLSRGAIIADGCLKIEASLLLILALKKWRQTNDLYDEIAQILYDEAPDEANKIIMRAELVSEGDSCKYEFDYVDRFGRTAWFTSTGIGQSRGQQLRGHSNSAITGSILAMQQRGIEVTSSLTPIFA
jgi:hypothetical protein